MVRLSLTAIVSFLLIVNSAWAWGFKKEKALEIGGALIGNALENKEKEEKEKKEAEQRKVEEEKKAKEEEQRKVASAKKANEVESFAKQADELFKTTNLKDLGKSKKSETCVVKSIYLGQPKLHTLALLRNYFPEHRVHMKGNKLYRYAPSGNRYEFDEVSLKYSEDGKLTRMALFPYAIREMFKISENTRLKDFVKNLSKHYGLSFESKIEYCKYAKRWENIYTCNDSSKGFQVKVEGSKDEILAMKLIAVTKDSDSAFD